MRRNTPSVPVQDAANILTQLITGFHALDMMDDSESKRDAVIIKCVALLVLTFDIPATSEEKQPNYEDAMQRLAIALQILKKP